MIVKLIVTKGQDDGKIFYVQPGAGRIIGRSSKTDITLRDVGVSRLHCEIRNDGRQAVAVDMNSKNGTTVNERRISGERVLADRDRIDLGTTALLVRLQADEGELPRLPSAPGEQVTTAPPPAPEAAANRAMPPHVAESTAAPAAASSPQAPQPVAEQDAQGFLGSFGSFVQETEQPPPTTPSGRLPQQEQPPAFEFAAPPPTMDEVPVAQPPAAAEEPPDAVDPGARIGMLIGGCRIETYIGKDEVCQVYRGVQVSMERQVVVKILDPKTTRDERAVQRFLHAARSGGRLSHPNIVQVYDAGMDHGLNFIVLEFVEGDSIRDRLLQQSDAPLPTDFALDVTDQILAALEHAHGLGVVHRNIRVDNIYITRHGVAKLADLGFAKSLDMAGQKRVTLQGESLGDLHFAAPEQLSDATTAGAQADIYSLGVVLYVMLTGRLPYLAQDHEGMLDQIRQGSRQPVQRLNPSVPDSVAAIVDRALAAQPTDRFDGAAEMRAAIQKGRELF